VCSLTVVRRRRQPDLGRHGSFPARSPASIWEAPSADELQRLLEGAFGDAVVHDVFVADPARSVNLPAPQTTAPA